MHSGNFGNNNKSHGHNANKIENLMGKMTNSPAGALFHASVKNGTSPPPGNFFNQKKLKSSNSGSRANLFTSVSPQIHKRGNLNDPHNMMDANTQNNANRQNFAGLFNFYDAENGLLANNGNGAGANFREKSVENMFGRKGPRNLFGKVGENQSSSANDAEKLENAIVEQLDIEQQNSTNPEDIDGLFVTKFPEINIVLVQNPNPLQKFHDCVVDIMNTSAPNTGNKEANANKSADFLSSQQKNDAFHLTSQHVEFREYTDRLKNALYGESRDAGFSALQTRKLAVFKLENFLMRLNAMREIKRQCLSASNKIASNKIANSGNIPFPLNVESSENVRERICAAMKLNVSTDPWLQGSTDHDCSFNGGSVLSVGNGANKNMSSWHSSWKNNKNSKVGSPDSLDGGSPVPDEDEEGISFPMHQDNSNNPNNAEDLLKDRLSECLDVLLSTDAQFVGVKALCTRLKMTLDQESNFPGSKNHSKSSSKSGSNIRNKSLPPRPAVNNHGSTNNNATGTTPYRKKFNTQNSNASSHENQQNESKRTSFLENENSQLRERLRQLEESVISENNNSISRAQNPNSRIVSNASSP